MPARSPHFRISRTTEHMILNLVYVCDPLAQRFEQVIDLARLPRANLRAPFMYFGNA